MKLEAIWKRSGDMSRGTIGLAAISILVVAGLAGADTMLPLQQVLDTSGFGTLHDSLIDQDFIGGSFRGTISSYVYVDQYPYTNTAYFVWDIQVTLASSPVADMSIAADLGVGQHDLKIGEIIANIGQHGVIYDPLESPVRKIPDLADAMNRVFPDPDEVAYRWLGANEIGTGERSTLYLKTSGAVDVEQINAAIRDGGVTTTTLLVLAPVDDPSSPDLEIPEPATLALLGIGSVALIRRRRE